MPALSFRAWVEAHPGLGQQAEREVHRKGLARYACPTCGGTGRCECTECWHEHDCYACDGTGHPTLEEAIDRELGEMYAQRLARDRALAARAGVEVMAPCRECGRGS